VTESQKNPGNISTFGDPYALDKFNRKTFCKEFKNDLMGKSSPPMNVYYKNLE
jgi:hypothetical protein